jgi:hypothetical protein
MKLEPTDLPVGAHSSVMYVHLVASREPTGKSVGSSSCRKLVFSTFQSNFLNFAVLIFLYHYTRNSEEG